MIMAPRLRKAVLTAHIASSVGLLGAITAFLALSVVGVASPDDQAVRGLYPAMAWIARLVIVPLALTSLLIGVVQSLGTPWGLFRHWWVVAKLLATAFATVVLLLKMPLIDYVARTAPQIAFAGDNLRAARLELTVHAAGGLMVLLLPMLLSVYKPRGLTRYGWRKQH